MPSIEIVLCSYSADCDAIALFAIQHSEDAVILVYETAAQGHDVRRGNSGDVTPALVRFTQGPATP
jgi:hypothetical protein